MKKYIIISLFFLMISALFAAEVTPPPVKKPHGALSGSFIYWQPRQDFMELGAAFPDAAGNDDDQDPFQPNLFSSSKASLIQFEPDFAPGFKIGASYFFDHDNWSLLVNNTYFRTENKLHRFINPAVAVTPQTVDFGFIEASWLSDATFDAPLGPSISAKWNLDVDILNFGLTRSCKVSQAFKVFPFIGGSAVWIDQKLGQNIELFDPQVGPFPPFFDTVSNVKSSSWALGPRFGLETNWFFVDSFYLQANLAADLLYTHYRLKTDQYVTNNSTIFIFSTNTLGTFRAELDGYVGFAWKIKFNKQLSLDLAAGYEIQAWWRQNMMSWYVSELFPTPQGNLYLQGLTATASLQF